jgi:hypothetical protein
MPLDTEIKAFIAKHGKDKVMARIPRYEDTIFYCVVDEERYKVEEGYKIGWKTKDGTFSRSFYQSDFDALVKDGHIRLFVNA